MNTINNSNYEEIYTPINFNSKEILRKEGWKDYMIERHHQKLDFILHQIYINRILNSKYGRRDYIKLSSKFHIERYLYADNVVKLKPLLYEYGVIENNDYYRQATEENGYSGECLGYRLTPKYDVSHQRVSVDKHSTLYKNIIRFRKKDLSTQDQVTQWIRFHMKDVGIRRDDAIEHVEQWYTNAILFYDPINIKKEQIHDDYEKVIAYKKQRYLYIINAIADGTIFNAKRDKRGRRVHHALTILWRELRQFIYLKSKPDAIIYNLDVANSQPFCLVKIILDAFGDKPLTEDVKSYIKLVCSGTLYKKLASVLNVHENDLPGFKVELFAKVFYSENHTSFYTKEAEAFRNMFPTVYQIIQQEKQVNYKDLAVAMQGVESQAIIDGVMVKLMHKYGDNHFFSSIHDSVLCEELLVDEVRELIIKHMAMVVGIEPTIKRAEYFNLPVPANRDLVQFCNAVEMFEWYDNLETSAIKEVQSDDVYMQ